MTATVTAPAQQPVARAGRTRVRANLATLGPGLLAAANALAFYIVRPGVNDLWAARARASAASHGVGLDYWFGWFGGGSTPGNYSILTPYLCAVIGTELVGALSAVAVTVLVGVLVRGTRHPLAAAWLGALAAALNLWSGRVPFLLGAVGAVAALIAVRRGHRSATVVLTTLGILASPVAGAFVALGLSGTFLTTRTKAYRPIIAYAVITAGVALGATALAFGTPGPEPFSVGLLLELGLGFALLFLAGPPDHLRTTVWVTVLAALVLFAVPNGMGSNLARFVWFCLPVAAVALSSRTARVAVLLVAPLLAIGGFTTVTDLRNASVPVSSTSYYASLIARIDRLPGLLNHRLELVDHGGRAGYDALLGHAMLARGWETQADNQLNRVLDQKPLDPITYKVWLDNNAVGFVALPTTSVGGYPEYTLVSSGQAGYLRLIWRNAKWQLFRVENPTPIVPRPATVLAHDQKSMTISVPCRCTLAVRVRWSKFLSAVLQQPAPVGTGTVDARPPQLARLTDDGTGWTVLQTSRPGTYVLRGSLRGLLH